MLPMRCLILSVSTLILSATIPALPAAELKRNAQIVEVATHISPKQIETNIRKLVGFGTRHTLSATTSETRGIGAARRWLQEEFERYADQSGGRLHGTLARASVRPG